MYVYLRLFVLEAPNLLDCTVVLWIAVVYPWCCLLTRANPPEDPFDLSLPPSLASSMRWFVQRIVDFFDAWFRARLPIRIVSVPPLS